MRVDVNDLDPVDVIVKCNKIETGRPVFFVHPIEGIWSPLKRLTSKCEFPAYCFQFTRDVSQDSIESAAARYIQVKNMQILIFVYSLVCYIHNFLPLTFLR